MMIGIGTPSRNNKIERIVILQIRLLMFVTSDGRPGNPNELNEIALLAGKGSSVACRKRAD